MGVTRVPVRTKDIERFGEHVVVYETSVYGECSHQHYDIAPLEYGGEHLEREREREREGERERGREEGERERERGERERGRGREGREEECKKVNCERMLLGAKCGACTILGWYCANLRSQLFTGNPEIMRNCANSPTCITISFGLCKLVDGFP